MNKREFIWRRESHHQKISKLEENSYEIDNTTSIELIFFASTRDMNEIFNAKSTKSQHYSDDSFDHIKFSLQKFYISSGLYNRNNTIEWWS